jgi:hypothetical protein
MRTPARTPARTALLLPLLLSACSVVVDVQTEPVSQDIPITSIGTRVYGEIGIDIPEEARGDIVEVTSLAIEALLVNAAPRSNLEFELRLSTEGRAEGSTPLVYAEAVAPAYARNATVLVPLTTVPAGRSAPVVINNARLLSAITTAPRIWLIAANTLRPAGALPDVPPVNLTLQNLVVKAQVVKSLENASGAQGALGL